MKYSDGKTLKGDEIVGWYGEICCRQLTKGRLAIRLFINVIQLIFGIFTLFMGGSEGVVASIANAVTNMLINLFVMGLMWLWTKIGVLLVMKSSRGNEYEADEFSFRLGYGNDLCTLLDTVGGSGAKGLFANLASSHPDKHDRIAKLQQLGATYRKEYVS